MKKEHLLARLRIAGYHNDTRDFTRLYLEGRVSLRVAQTEFATGVKLRESGMRCTCYECTKGK